MNLLLIFILLLGTIYSQGPNTDRPDIYGLINMLYLKADANLDGQITRAELSDVFQAFDKNSDGTVTNGEFEELWMALTSQTQALANANFHLADLNDDKVIDQKDYPIVYTVFDLNHDGAVSSREFVQKWEDIVRETPFAVLFERSDKNHDEFLTQAEFRTFFQSFDMDGNHRIDNREFDAGWAHADFALQSDADSLFRYIDSNGDHYITDADMDKLFGQYNANADDKLSLQEIIVMKSLLMLNPVGPGGK
ncbi:insoluble matrix shell protein 5-like isoform X2 [Dreissena polymorpha]|uniref:EF-hand domain-containing protein n=1 Tax=Dreissena polymorpha TaxID=45954 RepID=A0A9D4FFS4_DREPO|nr:insoluble matrix shell protein 5-like isoform X2 [Dreissena polymorpha]KAH3796889.1 hypothetical protein DPMN_150466 [Dreissena polymorpha]